MLNKTLLLVACAIMSWSAMLADDVTINGIKYRIYPSSEEAYVKGVEPGVKHMDIPEVVAYGGKNNKVMNIEAGCCKGNTTLESVTINAPVFYIGSDAFSGCTSLKNVTLKEGVKEIGYWCFKGCSSLEEIVLPNSITGIGQEAFVQCTSLKKVVFPKSFKVISESLFEKCTSLSEIVFPEDVEEIKGGAFNGCKALTKVTFPSTLRALDNVAFCATGLRIVYLPEGLNYMGNPFNGCDQLRLISFPSTLGSFGTFYLVDGIKQIECRSTTPPEIKSGTFMSELYTQTSVYVPKGCLGAYKRTGWSVFFGMIDDYSPFPLADTNGDKMINVGDVNRLINVIVGRDTPDYRHRDDVNRDDYVNVGDINEVLNAVLGK